MDIFSLALFYSMAFGLIVLNNGIFFDDWCLYHVDKASIMRMFLQTGQPWKGAYHIAILSLNNILICRAVNFFCYLGAAFFLYGALKGIRAIPRGERLLVGLFFALFPVNFTRITLITTPSSIAYLLFFGGLFLLSHYFSERKPFVRIAALLLFFISFTLQSLLVFYGVVILFLAYEERSNIKTVNGFLFFPIRYLDFFVAPIIFWVIKSIFFKPYGLYEGYNKVSLSNLFGAICKLNGAFDASFIAPLRETFQSLSPIYFTIMIFAVVVSMVACKAYVPKQDDVKARDFVLLFLGFFVFVLGVYPYLAVGKMPSGHDWFSRYQILVPLGAGFIIVYFVRIIFSNKGRAFAYSLLLMLFMGANFLGYLDYQKDWFKQLSLVENFKNSEILKNNASFLFNDKTSALNARNRTYRFYEYTGLMRLAFGNERRFGTVNRSDFDGDAEKYCKFGEYNCREYGMQKPQYEVIVDKGPFKLGYANALKLLWLKLIRSPKFKTKIIDILKFEYVKIAM